MAVVDLPATPLRVREATVHVSLDGLTHLSFDLEDGGLGRTGGLPTLDPAADDRAHAPHAIAPRGCYPTPSPSLRAQSPLPATFSRTQVPTKPAKLARRRSS